MMSVFLCVLDDVHIKSKIFTIKWWKQNVTNYEKNINEMQSLDKNVCEWWHPILLTIEEMLN